MSETSEVLGAVGIGGLNAAYGPTTTGLGLMRSSGNAAVTASRAGRSSYMNGAACASLV
jgi:hypothetical protein